MAIRVKISDIVGVFLKFAILATRWHSRKWREFITVIVSFMDIIDFTDYSMEFSEKFRYIIEIIDYKVLGKTRNAPGEFSHIR